MTTDESGKLSLKRMTPGVRKFYGSEGNEAGSHYKV
jgi:hypothetical protein